jgi:hypothetical protein
LIENSLKKAGGRRQRAEGSMFCRGFNTVLNWGHKTRKLKRGEPESKSPNLSGDLEGSKTFDTEKRTFQTSSKKPEKTFTN